MIMLPPFVSELVAALVAAIAALTVVRSRRPRLELHDAEREIAALTARVRTKANHPRTYRLRQWMR